MSQAYYNERDRYAAEWLRNLIAAGHIAPGDVDERDIRDVAPDDLARYTQCHFFAGIGVWSYALRLAGWPDDKPVWTGSCPCQPFSAAGARAGFADERHLWPHWHWLIEQCRPAVVLGEQVASKDGLGWLDLVQADMAGADYTVGAVDICAAGVGAPHIRQRLYFVGVSDADGGQRNRIANGEERQSDGAARGRQQGDCGVACDCSACRLPDAESGRQLEERENGGGRGPGDRAEGWPAGHSSSSSSSTLVGVEEPKSNRRDGALQSSQRQKVSGILDASTISGLADTDGRHASAERQQRSGQHRQQQQEDRGAGGERPGAVNGFWRAADWLLCRDGRWRPVEPGAFPLASGAPARVGRLRAYGNALNAEIAATFVEAVRHSLGDDLI